MMGCAASLSEIAAARRMGAGATWGPRPICVKRALKRRERRKDAIV